MSTQAQRALLLQAIMEAFEQRVNAFLDYASEHRQADLAELEGKARELNRECLAPALAGVVAWREQSLSARPRCKQCGREMTSKGKQAHSQETYVGRITWQRGYYHCRLCQRGCYPLDESLGIGAGQFSEGVQSGVARLGVLLPFGIAGETFTALTGISIAEREVERITEDRGSVWEEAQAQERRHGLEEGYTAGVGAEQPCGNWGVALDAAKVLFREDKAWHDVNVGVVFEAQAKVVDEQTCGAEAHAQSYLGTVGPQEDAGERLYAEALKRGIDPGKQRVICLGDGAVPIWNQFALHFPQRVEVLDYYHADEHLWAAAKGCFAEGSETGQKWIQARQTELWAGQIEALLTALENQAQQAQGEAAKKEIHYFSTNKERMRYASFRSQGYPIGSGTVESTCKRLVIGRLRQAGMSWMKPGAQAVLSLRAELLSGRWDQAWKLTHLPAKLA